MHISYPLQDDMLLSASNLGQAIAIGDFDGVHLGHRQVIGEAVRAARTEGLSSAVMTFHPHPRQVLGSAIYASCLTPLDRKLLEFERLGVERVYVVRFDDGLSKLSPSDFIQQVLLPLGVRHVVVGFNFSFGHKGAGSPQLLEELSADAYRVTVVQPYRVEEHRISSTLIRASLSAGDVGLAGTLLGRPYEITGTVVHGEGRGRTIGVPTANVKPDGAYVLPANGVYAVTVKLAGGETVNGVMNVGKKPTFHDNLPEPTCEVHLLDFDGDLYGRSLAVQFKYFIRSERKFESVDALIAQIKDDIRKAGQLLQPST
ncbi:bifunctional riboflavin kinase/FAD synthetase [Paenibacillus thermotolerans]|uniref:bifunctional riboflavin kinase/FAD synthetase n=1 Tax=Paenibacillus thermotolerans TaxID=3027807 RepID=UPI0023684C4D|nr:MULTISPECIES: bifunctional riboflavin kinase/FAD synthetase [unclassified Paenibacillus]